jgi:hypothetical protein
MENPLITRFLVMGHSEVLGLPDVSVPAPVVVQ